MSFATKPITMATNGCLNSIPSLFTKPNALYSHSNLSIPLKPLKLHLSLSTLKKQTTHLRFTVIAALQEENNPVLVEEQEFLGNLNWDNQETSEGEVEVEVGEESDGVMEAFEDDGESDGYAEPPEEAKMYVGNLPFDVDSEKLAQLFEQAGVVEISEVIYNRVTDQSRGFGFVTMSTVEEAEKAVEMFNRYDLNGRLLVVNKAAPKGSRPERPPRVSEPAYRIYIGNLPWSAHDGRLEQIFSEHGKVVSARVVYDRESGRSRGFGFVTMSSKSEMNDAIANLDGQSLEGRVIRVNIAEERARNNSF